MKYECVAVVWNTLDCTTDARFMDEREKLLSEGWEFYAQAKRLVEASGGAAIMRRPKDEPQKYFHTRHCLCDECGKKRDEPRKWTKAELRELIAHDRELVKSIVEDAQTEADMQTAYRKEVQKRNVELQEAIDQVVCAARAPWDDAAVPTLRIVHRVFYPLATKKED